MLFRTLGVLGKRFAQAFLPSKIAGLQLWLDATDTDTINAKMSADFVSANSEYLSSASTDFDKGNESFSWGGWFNFDDTDSTNLIGKSTVGQVSYVIWKNATNFKVDISADGTTDTTLTSSESYSTSTWIFLVAVYDSVNDLLKLSVDGGNFNTVSNTLGAYSSSTADFRIGEVTFDGLADGAFFYDKALSQAEVTTLYNSGNGQAYTDVDTTSLVSYWQMNELSGNRSDSHGSNTLTDNNTVTSALGKIQEPIANNEYVWRMLDKSGNDNHVTQGTAAAQPTWANSGFGSKNTAQVTLDGVDDFLQNVQSLTDSQGTLIMVVDSATATEVFASFNVGATTRYLDIGFDGTNLYGSQRNADTADTFVGNTAISANTPYVVAMASDESQYYLWLNNGIETISMTSGVDNGDWIDSITSGTRGYFIGRTRNSYYQFSFTEYLYYNVKITDSEFQSIASYLNSKYGIY